MAFYQIDTDNKARPTDVVFDEKDTEGVERLGGATRAAKWKPLSAILSPRGPVTELFLLGAPIVGPRAWKVLEPVLGAHVEALPLSIKGATRVVLNVLSRIDAMDGARSELWQGKKKGVVYRVNKLVLRDDVEITTPIFVLAGVEISPVVVDETVKKAIEASKLKGWKFTRVGGGKAAKAAPAKATKVTKVARVKGDGAAVADAWKRIDAWLDAAGIDLGLRPGATAARIAKVEATIGAPLPDDVVASLRRHDGQRDDAPGIDEWTLLGCEGIEREWTTWQGVAARGDLAELASEPVRGVKDAWWNPRWIPLTSNGAGDHLCADLDPAKGGVAGQVITMWHAEAARARVAKGLGEWLERLASGLERKRWGFDDGALRESAAR